MEDEGGKFTVYRYEYSVYPYATGPYDPYYQYAAYDYGSEAEIPNVSNQQFYPDYQEYQSYPEDPYNQWFDNYMPDQQEVPPYNPFMNPNNQQEVPPYNPFMNPNDYQGFQIPGQHAMTPSQKQMLLQYFQDENGEVDLDKVFKTLGQVVQITQQVSPLIKTLNTMVRGS
ncbi:hypothetical protein J2R98_002817 [Alkalibacillus filiformis]|uniref:YppG-like protein n=1 Tax=Alkalibacillus filiformis TaxID=200990 RepID=A0ABU0DX56_9BACI|nr:hypothetical protein [Alkalibacillus filiformis]